ncbi:MAG: hypothetical protein AABX01_01975 [Candidatus Micrarchaeota archaeon]
MDRMQNMKLGFYLGSFFLAVAAAYFYYQDPAQTLMPAILLLVAFSDLFVFHLYLKPILEKQYESSKH